jgi:hypothetical protein
MRLTRKMFEHVKRFVTFRNGLRKLFTSPIDLAIHPLNIHDNRVDVGAFTFRNKLAH